MNIGHPDGDAADNPGSPQPRQRNPRTFQGTRHDGAERHDRLEDLLNLDEQVSAALADLNDHASVALLHDMPTRYGIHTANAVGVSMADMKAVAARLGRSHPLAEALWATGLYEARIVASMIDEPERVTLEQMERWCHDFDNWAICDTVCFHLFDRTPHAWIKVEQWAAQPDEFVKRAAFALLWGLARHDRDATDAQFAAALRLIECEATDERPLVKKSVSMALRSIGKRNPVLHASARTVAESLAEAPGGSARWIGRAALRDLALDSARRVSSP